jgi:hypothetical protein
MVENQKEKKHWHLLPLSQLAVAALTCISLEENLLILFTSKRMLVWLLYN